MNRIVLEDDADLFIDPREHIIERYGHGRYYAYHYCHICEQESPCKIQLCKLDRHIECLPCATRQLLEDTERFSKEAREFIGTEVPTDLQGQMWWKALRSEIDGKLKGLGTRAKELMKRQDQVQA